MVKVIMTAAKKTDPAKPKRKKKKGPPRKTQAENRIRQLKKDKFIAAFKLLCNISKAAVEVGISRLDHYDWLKTDPKYVEAYEAALEPANGVLEDEMRRRAIDGVAEPVYYKGDVCGSIQKYSDTLAIFLAKGAMPDKYKERHATELTGAGGGEIKFDPGRDKLSNEQLEALIALAQEACPK